jgi:hypothetical protein
MQTLVEGAKVGIGRGFGWLADKSLEISQLPMVSRGRGDRGLTHSQ